MRAKLKEFWAVVAAMFSVSAVHIDTLQHQALLLESPKEHGVDLPERLQELRDAEPDQITLSPPSTPDMPPGAQYWTLDLGDYDDWELGFLSGPVADDAAAPVGRPIVQ